MIKNKLDMSFGPVGTPAGIFLFLAGLVLVFFHFSGLLLVLIGAFVGFTYSGTLIDTGKKRIRFSNFIFGIIPTGKWIPVDSSMKAGIRASNQIYSAFSQGNRSLDIDKKDFRIILYDSGDKEIMQVKKFGSVEAAKSELDRLRNQLGLMGV
jgi:hypothetical protein